MSTFKSAEKVWEDSEDGEVDESPTISWGLQHREAARPVSQSLHDDQPPKKKRRLEFLDQRIVALERSVARKQQSFLFSELGRKAQFKHPFSSHFGKNLLAPEIAYGLVASEHHITSLEQELYLAKLCFVNQYSSLPRVTAEAKASSYLARLRTPFSLESSMDGNPSQLVHGLNSRALCSPHLSHLARDKSRLAFSADSTITSNFKANLLQLTSTADKSIHDDQLMQQSSLSKKGFLCLAADEDHNWLSEFQCFVRSELIEVFQADHQDVKDRRASKNVLFQQVGIRCRFCARLPFDERAGRSSAYPSSIPQIYQSFTMMVRDHFDKCSVLPTPVCKKFKAFKNTNSQQGDINSKEYWKYACAKLGMADSENGIVLNEQTRLAASKMPPFGPIPRSDPGIQGSDQIILVTTRDRHLISDFLYIIMSQLQVVHLLPWECKGSRKNVRIGQPGLGCRHCCQAGRLGLCRIFPHSRRKLPDQVYKLFDHIQRCTLCPREVKLLLAGAGRSLSQIQQEMEKDFFDGMWKKLENFHERDEK